MSNKEIQSIQICGKLSQASGSEWVAIKFEKATPVNNIEPARFCEAVYKAQKKHISLSFSNICCDGAKRCFGWLKDNDIKLAQRLSEKTGIGQDIAYELIKSVPAMNEKFSGISIGKDIGGDVYISYASPESAMKLVRFWQKITGQNLKTDISGIMSVCGNVAVKSYIEQKISISFGCPDSRKYGGIAKELLVIGLPQKIALRMCIIDN
jgi:uncharacterized protein (DUF169 family)